MASSRSKEYMLARDGETFGPYSTEAIREMARAGRVTGDMQIWTDGMADWQPVSTVKGLGVMPPPPPGPVYVAPLPDAEPARVTGHVTTERTGKGIKAAIVINWLTYAVAVGMIYVGAQVQSADADDPNIGVAIGGLLFVFALFRSVYLRWSRWWHHG